MKKEMTWEELLALLDIDEPGEFQYFENIAEILESDEDIPVSALYPLFSRTDTETVSGLLQEYFEDVIGGLPDDQTDMVLLMENIRRVLVGLLRAPEEREKALVHFAEEVDRFRKWYCFSELAVLPCAGGTGAAKEKGGAEKRISVRDGLCEARLAKLEGRDAAVDFTDCLAYELDEYIMTYADFAGGPEEDAEREVWQEEL